jgi:hypothetical protein
LLGVAIVVWVLLAAMTLISERSTVVSSPRSMPVLSSSHEFDPDRSVQGAVDLRQGNSASMTIRPAVTIDTEWIRVSGAFMPTIWIPREDVVQVEPVRMWRRTWVRFRTQSGAYDDVVLGGDQPASAWLLHTAARFGWPTNTMPPTS